MGIFEFLQEHGIEFQRFDHPAVFTCEEADRLVPAMPGVKSKNLFLRDRRGRRHFLVIVPAEKSVDLKSLSRALGASGLSLASADRLKKHLKVEPGSISFLSIYNNIKDKVEVVFDDEIWTSDYLQSHPLVNTSTLLLSHEAVVRLLGLTGHEYRVLEIPERNR